jgi:hydrogenase nickel incorporation protein HypB
MKRQPSIAPAGEPAAVKNREAFKEAKVLAVALVGPPGAGKTALIEATARQLRGHMRVAVITVNPAADRDANRVSRYCDQVQAVNTTTPDAATIAPAVQNLDLKHTDILFIESFGGISGAPDFGQDVTVTVLSVAGGDDKAAEYASLLSRSQALILSKCELRRHVMFDRGAFRADARRINPIADLLEVSAFENTGLGRWLHWLDLHRQKVDPDYRPSDMPPPLPEWFFG